MHYQNKAWILFLIPSLCGVLIFLLLPYLDVIRRSFYRTSSKEYYGLTYYHAIMENQAFLLAVKNTSCFIITCLPILIILGFVIAVVLSKLYYTVLLKLLFLFPMTIPAASVVLVWKMVFAKQGFLNILLNQHIDYMSEGWSFYILVFTYVWKNIGYTIILWLYGILQISPDLLEAAKMDGAGKYRIMISIMIPNLKDTFFTIVVLSFLNSFKVFREAYLVAGAYPQEDMYLLQHLFNNWFVQMEFDKMSAAAVCIGLVLFCIILLLEKLWKAGGTIE